MGSTYTSLHFHLVFSTKERCPFIHSAWRSRLHEYLGGTIRGLGGVADSVGGTADHVHVLASLNATHRLADFMRELKKASSIWAAQKHERAFAWQDGYAAFSAGAAERDRLRHYIAHQEVHHRGSVFIDELRHLLEAHSVRYDSIYSSSTDPVAAGLWHPSRMRACGAGRPGGLALLDPRLLSGTASPCRSWAGGSPPTQ